MNSEKTKTLSFSALLHDLIQSLEDKSYDRLTLDNYRRTLRKIEPYMDENGIEAYTPEVGRHYYEFYLAKNKLSISRQKAIITAIRRLNDFYSGIEYKVQRQHQVELLPDNFENFLDLFSLRCNEAGNKVNTIKAKKRFIRCFLKDCIDLGCMDIYSLNPSDVAKACLRVENKDGWAIIRAFLKFLSINGIIEADFSTLVPRYRKPTHLPDTYSEKEIFQIEKVIDRTSNIGKRDYAMLLLATRLGMRSGDIVKLSLADLDFRRNQINFIQQKTGERLRLLMLTEVKIALTDYINNARPKATGDTVFLRQNAPFKEITTSVLRFVTTRYFKMAGIDITDKKHGPHTFRSSLANSMINDDVPYEAVTKILGHTDSDAIKHYAKLDLDKLRECAIEVPRPSGTFKAFLDGGINV